MVTLVNHEKTQKRSVDLDMSKYRPRGRKQKQIDLHFESKMNLSYQSIADAFGYDEKNKDRIDDIRKDIEKEYNVKILSLKSQKRLNEHKDITNILKESNLPGEIITSESTIDKKGRIRVLLHLKCKKHDIIFQIRKDKFKERKTWKCNQCKKN